MRAVCAKDARMDTVIRNCGHRDGAALFASGKTARRIMYSNKHRQACPCFVYRRFITMLPNKGTPMGSDLSSNAARHGANRICARQAVGFP